ncbi:MAG: 30S ribosomal protein S6 [Thermodesulfobacteriota bacterium]
MSAELRDYETLSIVNPDVGVDGVKDVIAKGSAIISGDGGTIHNVDEWGRRKLAYPIQKKNEGYYFLILYKSTLAAQSELERVFKLNEDVIRTQSIRLDEDDVAVLLEEARIAREKAAANEAQAAERAKAAEEAAKVRAAEAAKTAEAAKVKAAEAEVEKAKAAEAEPEKAEAAEAESTEDAPAAEASEGTKEVATKSEAEGGTDE